MEENITVLSEQQKIFLTEKKHILFEYYTQVSNPKHDANILGNIQVWIYGDDRNGFTPHCHVMESDRSIEFEVSLIDFEIINIKKEGKRINKMLKSFYEWLDKNSTRIKGNKNKEALWGIWDGDNPNNSISDFIKEHKIKVQDGDLLEYLEWYDNNKVVIK